MPRGDPLMEARTATERLGRGGTPAWVLGVVPLLLIAAAIGLFAALGGPGLGDRNGVPVEELAVERTVLRPGVIELTVRNDGPDAVSIAQAMVNDAFVAFTGPSEPIERLRSAKVTVRQPWIEGEAYEVVLLTSTGGTVAHAIDAAAETPDADLSFFALMALLGLYVGVVPVLLGMLWLPWVRRIPATWLQGDHGADGRPAGVPGDRRDARGPRARGRRARRPSAARRSSSSARSSPTSSSAASARGSPTGAPRCAPARQRPEATRPP